MRLAGVWTAGVGAGIFVVAAFVLSVPGLNEEGKKKARGAFMTGVAIIAAGILLIAEAK